MYVVYKYLITSGQNFKIEIPKQSKYLDVQIQDNYIAVWYMVDKSIRETEIKGFVVLMTGQFFDLSDDLKYLKTLQTEHGLVYHVFEENE